MIETDLYMATRFDNQSAHSFSGPSLMNNRLKDVSFDELSESLTQVEKQSLVTAAGSQRARNLALQSLMQEFQQNFESSQEDAELLIGKHFHKQDKLAKKAVDEFHLHLAALVD